ncbi:hypothetical protein ACJ41O_003427 [Fusarium nematophilum]
MVKIAVAGGSSNVGQEIIEALVSRNKHEILLLSRKVSKPQGGLPPGVSWVKADYEDVAQLTKVLEGVETVLSFIIDSNDGKYSSQRNLIDAAVKAGVKRFAPSEWATARFDHLPWYQYKIEIRKYLAEINKDKKYTLFHPGLFTNYMTFPFPSSKHVEILELPFNFHKRRALICEGAEDSVVTLTTAQDAAKVIALAVEYNGEWPTISGIKGADLTIGQLIALGEKIRGGAFDVEKLGPDELKTGTVKAVWRPKINHHSIPPETLEAVSDGLISGLLLSFKAEAWKSSDEWNQLLPDFKFTQPEEFLSEAWAAIDAGAKSVFAEN